ncbi:hypothetical protein [Actinoplanes sp. NPDC026670]|uniref:hypothetical protein n=1 Tax=Actinoplanes sp. NPDC026670 TaxID=3154700 RepID=UPI0033E0E783
MRPGEIRYHPHREDGFLVVSAAAFNVLPGNPVVWGVPYTSAGYDPMRLTHLDRTLFTDQADSPADPSSLRQVLRFVHWAFVGDQAFWDATPAQRQAHEAALGESDEVDQGDVVVDDDGMSMVVISGPGFNSTPGSDLLWTVRVESDGTVHPHLVMNRTRQELRATPFTIGPDALRRQLVIIERDILNLPPLA